MTDSTTEMAWLARRFPLAVTAGGDLDAVDVLVTRDYVGHYPFVGDVRGPAAAKEAIRAFRFAFPDVEATVETVAVDGDRVTSRVTLRGTHRGPLFGVSATGNEVTVRCAVVTRFADGWIAERWVSFDVPAFLDSLGVTADALDAPVG